MTTGLSCPTFALSGWHHFPTWTHYYLFSVSCLSNNRLIAQPNRCRVSGATGANACTPTRLRWNRNSHSNSKSIEFIKEVSIAVEFRDANRVFEKVSARGRLHLCPMIADSRGQRPDCPLESPWKRLGVHYDVNVSRDQ